MKQTLSNKCCNIKQTHLISRKDISSCVYSNNEQLQFTGILCTPLYSTVNIESVFSSKHSFSWHYFPSFFMVCAVQIQIFFCSILEWQKKIQFNEKLKIITNKSFQWIWYLLVHLSSVTVFFCYDLIMLQEIWLIFAVFVFAIRDWNQNCWDF